MKKNFTVLLMTLLTLVWDASAQSIPDWVHPHGITPALLRFIAPLKQ